MGLAIYDDRLEIGSVGPLPFGQTPQDLMKPHPSRPWNPIIAGVFHRRGIIEQWGRGTLKMAELAHRAGLPTPEFESTAHEVVVRFQPTKYVPPLRINHDLTGLQRQLLEIVARVGPCQLAEITAHLPENSPRRTVQNNLKLLAQLGLLDAPTKRGGGALWKLKGAPA